MRLMKLAAFTSLTVLGTSAAATVGPPIAYEYQASTGAELFLVNADGTGLREVYRGPRKSSITQLDLRPGGGEIAFIEGYKLKVLNYDSSGLAIGTARSISVPCATILTIDHHPTDGSIVAADGCSPRHLWRIAAGASAADAQPLLTSQSLIADPHWSSDGSRIYL